MDTFLVRVWRPAVARGVGELTLCGTVEHLPSQHRSTFHCGDDLLSLLDGIVGPGGGDVDPWVAPGRGHPREVPGGTHQRAAPGDADPSVSGEPRYGAGGPTA